MTPSLRSLCSLAAILLPFSINTASSAVRYVDANNLAPAPPYTTWATAATNIQDAVDVAATGDEILVTNGVYQTGVREVYGMSNRVAVTKAVVVQSVNGPGVTSIVGYRVPGTPNGPAAVRCVYLTNGAVLAGFTLTSGATGGSGGGVWCEGETAIVSNCTLTGNSASSGGGASGGTLNHCTLTGNSADYAGGGSSGGTLNNCTLTGNTASSWYLDWPTLWPRHTSGGGASGATLNHCTLAGNSAYEGGGAAGGTLNHCTLTGNSAQYGGGASGGTLNNCTLTGNTAYPIHRAVTAYGGGAYESTLNNCTLTGNSAHWNGGGAYAGTLNNCIAFYNTASAPFGTWEDNYSSSSLNNCCTAPLPASGTGNITNAPLFVDTNGWSDLRLQATSPCINAGNNAYVTNSTDLVGRPRIVDGTVDLGAYEFQGNPPVIVFQPQSQTNEAGTSASFTVAATGTEPLSFQWWKEGGILVDGAQPSGARVSGATTTNLTLANLHTGDAGNYTVVVSNSQGSVTSQVASLVVTGSAIYYVWGDNPGPVFPYTTWATAARDIQDAVDVAGAGDLILVTNGVYRTGAREVYGMSNRVAVTKPVTVRSVNGPANTIIRGYQVPETTNGPAAVRCVYLTNEAVLSGFTLTQGATQTAGDSYRNGSGGGVWCEGPSAVVSNCVLTGNSAYFGGGAYEGTLHNCTLTGNTASAWGGGATFGTLNNCTLTGNSAENYGGGAYGGTLNHCTLTGNSAGEGGGAYGGTLNDCALTGNSASRDGGGAFGGTLNHCTLTGNSASRDGGGACYGTLNNGTLAGNSAAAGGGAYWATLNNCIVYYNRALSNGPNYLASTLNYCCTTPLPPGPGNITHAPLFVDTNGWSDLRLQATSPCVGAGNNAYASGSTDLAGNPRIVGGTVDMGAYESQWINHPLFGWLWDSGTGWFGGSAYGWMWFDAGGQWIWSTGLQGWLGIADPNSRTLWSTQFRWLTPAADDAYVATTSSLGLIHVGVYHGTLLPDGTTITDGWVVSDRFGFVWAAGDGVWFYSTSYGWLGVTEDGGIWCVDQARFL